MSAKPVLKGLRGLRVNKERTDEEMKSIFEVDETAKQTDITAEVPVVPSSASGLFKRLSAKASAPTLASQKAVVSKPVVPKKMTMLPSASMPSTSMPVLSAIPEETSSVSASASATAFPTTTATEMPGLPNETTMASLVMTAPEKTYLHQQSLEPSKEFRFRDKVNPDLRAQQELIEEYVTQDKYSIPEEQRHYIPESSRDFRRFINTTFSTFTLPPRLGDKDWEACSKRGETVDMYNYQKFVREYMRQASPYRGALVYHGLGSGKTCTSIAASEALYGSTNKRIIVMTPIALKKNFITELGFCGFRHYRVKENFWVPYSFKGAPMNRLFATEVVGIPSNYLKWLETARSVGGTEISETERVFFMPDFSKPSSESNYESLTPIQKSLLERQIRETIESKIEFIGYTGISKEKLKQMAVGTYKGKIPLKPGQKFFDDAIIIIDEVHNLTRLISGSLDSYLKDTTSGPVIPGKRKPRRLAQYEPIEVTPWDPKLKTSPQLYDRSYLFYRLLAEARNSKIIALSGTPIVNVPDEIGILGNILHGYFHTAECALQTVDDTVLNKIKAELLKHPRIEYFDMEKASNLTKLFVTRLEEGYIRSFDESGKYLGVVYVGGGAVPNTIEEIFVDVDAIIKKYNIRIMTGASGVKFKAIPLFPPFYEEFNKYFVNTNDATMINKNLFKKRISGLISYYKGAKEELMPAVRPGDDKIEYVDMSEYALPAYVAAREKERGETSGNAFEEGAQIGADESKATSYRFNSRSVCNFVFPETVKRPFPNDAKDFQKAAGVDTIVVADAVTAVVPDLTLAERVEEEEADKEDEVVPAVATMAATAAAVLQKPYEQRVKEALELLRADAMNDAKLEDGVTSMKRFQMDEAVPVEFRLSTYSPKFKKMIENIENEAEIPGSSLIYSQFRTMEGIGIFSIILDSLGWQRIEIKGTKMENLEFTPQTIESFTDPAKRDAKRYIIYSGEESTDIRQALINVFNVRGFLPESIKSVMEASGLTPTKNLHGEICKVFMITGAGAEGLSLRAVRAVHIMEPYWNAVRTDQVKGRAIRICSHEDLPVEERYVKIYTYITKFSEHMKTAKMIDLQITQLDNNKTSDEHVQLLSDTKSKVNSEFIQCLKEAAVDCVLNESENERVQCYLIEGNPLISAYDPRIDVDANRTTEQVIVPQIQARPVTSTSAVQPPPGMVTSATASAPSTAPSVTYKAFKAKDGKIFIRAPRIEKETGKPYVGIYAIQDKATLRSELGRAEKDAEGKETMVWYPVPKEMS